MHFQDSEMKCIILNLSNPVSMSITNSEDVFGRQFTYQSHVQQHNIDGDISYSSMFNSKGKVCYQNTAGEICESTVNIQENVKLVSFLITNNDKQQTKHDHVKFVFGTPQQKKLYKVYQSVMSPEKHAEKKIKQKDYEKERSNLMTQAEKNIRRS